MHLHCSCSCTKNWVRREKNKSPTLDAAIFVTARWSAPEGSDKGGMWWSWWETPPQRQGQPLGYFNLPFAPPGTMSPAHMCCYSVTHSCGRRCNWLQLQLQLFACLFVCLLAGLPYECEYFAGFLGLLLSAGHPTPSSPGSPAESVGKTSFVLLIMFLITWPGDELFHGSDIQLKVEQKYTNLWLHMETIVVGIDFQKLQSLNK